MEIGPIPGIRALPAVKSRPADPQLSAVFDIDALARTGDSEWTDGRKKASGVEEDEDDELASGDDAPDAPQSSISYFA